MRFVHRHLILMRNSPLPRYCRTLLSPLHSFSNACTLTSMRPLRKQLADLLAIHPLISAVHQHSALKIMNAFHFAFQ
jgi:hypothetical protein